MIEQILDIPTKDGAMETFVCHPERGGPYPPVLLLMDAPGIREELRDMARRLATVGYYVLLPNLYYRAGTRHDLRPGRAGAGQRRACAHARRAHQDDDPAGDGRRGGDARLRRRDRRRSKQGTGRRPWLLHERALCAGRRRALSRPHRRRGVVLRHLAGERRRREPASHARQGQGRALHRLRRARRSGAAAHGRGAEGAVRQVRRRRARSLSRACITASPSRSAGATTSPPPNGTGKRLLVAAASPLGIAADGL